jgi:hypothetical protein
MEYKEFDKQIKTKARGNPNWVKGKSGNPKGRPIKFTLKDYITEKEVKQLVNLAKQQAYKKPEILRFILEQIFGKAKQSLDVASRADQINPMSYERALLIFRDKREFKKDNSQHSIPLLEKLKSDEREKMHNLL